MRSRFLCFFAALVTAISPIRAQDGSSDDSLEAALREPLPKQSDPIAEQLFATSVKAMGGPEALTFETMSANMVLSRGPQDMRLKLLAKRPDKVWTQASIKHLGTEYRVTAAFDGTHAWILDESSENAFANKIGGDDAEELDQLALGEDILISWKEKGCILEYLGPVNSRKQKNYLVKLYHPDGLTEYFYFHAKNYLLTRRGKKEKEFGTIIDVDAFFVKYEKINGLWLVTETEIAFEGEVVMKMVAEGIKINQSIPDSQFDMPEFEETWLKGKGAQ